MITVDHIMSTRIIQVNPDNTVADLCALLDNASFHHLPVVSKQGQLLGIVSDRDLTRNLSPFFGTEQQRPEDAQLLLRPVTDIMSNPVITIDTATSVDCASILLLENNISCLPVVEPDQRLAGLLTWKDILKYHVYSDVESRSESVNEAQTTLPFEDAYFTGPDLPGWPPEPAG